MAKTVILANGSFPRKGGASWKLLESVKRVVACDGAANAYLRRFHRFPSVIIGDMDSFHDRGGATRTLETDVSRVYIADQNTNDLTKAIDFCRGKGWKDLVIVGATGKREDHELGNIFRAMNAGVEVVTDYGRFVPVAKTIRMRVNEGTPISVFATDRRTKMKSKGLKWSLNSVEFKNLYCATLNRAASDTVEITASLPFFVFIASGKVAVA